MIYIYFICTKYDKAQINDKLLACRSVDQILYNIGLYVIRCLLIVNLDLI